MTPVRSVGDDLIHGVRHRDDGDGDYISKSGTITFAAGQTMKAITIEVKGDNKKESNETFYLDTVLTTPRFRLADPPKTTQRTTSDMRSMRASNYLITARSEAIIDTL